MASQFYPEKDSTIQSNRLCQSKVFFSSSLEQTSSMCVIGVRETSLSKKRTTKIVGRVHPCELISFASNRLSLDVSGQSIDFRFGKSALISVHRDACVLPIDCSAAVMRRNAFVSFACIAHGIWG